MAPSGYGDVGRFTSTHAAPVKKNFKLTSTEAGQVRNTLGVTYGDYGLLTAGGLLRVARSYPTPDVQLSSGRAGAFRKQLIMRWVLYATLY